MKYTIGKFSDINELSYYDLKNTGLIIYKEKKAFHIYFYNLELKTEPISGKQYRIFKQIAVHKQNSNDLYIIDKNQDLCKLIDIIK